MDYLIEAMEKFSKEMDNYDRVLNVQVCSMDVLKPSLAPVSFEGSEKTAENPSNRFLGVPISINKNLPEYFIVMERTKSVQIYDMRSKEVYKITKEFVR